MMNSPFAALAGAVTDEAGGAPLHYGTPLGGWLLYTSEAADHLLVGDLRGCRYM